MDTRLNPYLGFLDTARQAMDFYQSVFGGVSPHKLNQPAWSVQLGVVAEVVRNVDAGT